MRVFSDIDECAMGRQNCSADAVCNNTKGSYNCTCKEGYYGDGNICRSGNILPAVFLKLGKFAALLLLFLSSALDTANNASYENTSDQERCLFPIPRVNFLFESISKLHPIFFS